MRVGVRAEIMVKYKSGSAVYQVSKYRTFAKLIDYFRSKNDFCFAQLYQIDQQKNRIRKIAYFDNKNTFELYL